MYAPPSYTPEVHKVPLSRPTFLPRPGSWSPGSQAAELVRPATVRLHRELSHQLIGKVLTPADVPMLARLAARIAAADHEVDEQDATDAIWAICQETWSDVESLEGEELRLVLKSMVRVCSEMMAPPAAGSCCRIC
jgi:hypothetical protein